MVLFCLQTADGSQRVSLTVNPSDLGFTARAVTRSYTNGSGETFGYAHDANGNQTLLTLPDTKTITYGYDNRDRLETITDWANRVTTLTWDDANRLKSVTRPNNTVRSLFYDGAGQLTRIEERTGTGRLIQMVELGLDDLGRAERRFTVPLPALASFPAPNYTYNKDNWINELDYDADGNMKTLPAVPAPIGQPNLRALPGLKTTTGTLATWDSRNRLTSIKLADGSTQQYKYDAENQRISKRIGTQVTSYVHNAHGLSGMSECTIEVLPDGSQRLYIWGGPAGLLYDVSIPANSSTETLRYYHADQVGSTMALTNQSGTVIGRAEYTPYGLITLRSGDTNTPFLYNGAFGVMTDIETGIVHMRARYYHPWLARFINADPSGFGGGMNMYAFADGDPIMLLDALGLDAQGIRYRNQDGSMNWSGAAKYVYEGVKGVPAYIAKNGASSFKRNVSDPKFVMEAAAGGIGGAELGAFNRTAQAVSRAAPVVNRAANNVTRWGPATGAGPLGEGVAATFRGGSYTETVTQEATTLFRAYGGNAGELGSYWTKTAPAGPLQTRIDSALLPKWGNTAESVSTITVPKGNTIFEGFAAPQGSLMGGGSQVFIPEVNPIWLLK